LETTEETRLSHVDGVVSMTLAEPNTATSSFFICIGDQPELDYAGKRNPYEQGFASFGQVIEGMGVVREIQKQKDERQHLLEPGRIASI